MWNWQFSLSIFAVFLPLVATAQDRQIRVVTDGQNEPVAVEVTRLPRSLLDYLATLGADHAHWPPLLSVFVVGEDGKVVQPPLAGQYSVEKNAARFTPRFSFRPGMKYEAQIFLPRDGKSSPHFDILRIEVPAAPLAEPTKVTAIYPTANVLPDNQLRFYIHFSSPMAAGEAYQHIKLLKANGEPVYKPFLDIGEEMWDGSFQRLTLLFHPGRVKKGIRPREELGPVIEKGKTYTLVIDKGWRDANGQPLASGFEKRFTAGPPVEAIVDPANWKITAPAAGTKEPLVIRFPYAMDNALARRMITVAGSTNPEIEGEIMLDDDQRFWRFRPEQPWQAGEFVLVIDKSLEDTAGNNLRRPFEVDVFERVDKESGPEYARIPLNIPSTRK